MILRTIRKSIGSRVQLVRNNIKLFCSYGPNYKAIREQVVNDHAEWIMTSQIQEIARYERNLTTMLGEQSCGKAMPPLGTVVGEKNTVDDYLKYHLPKHLEYLNRNEKIKEAKAFGKEVERLKSLYHRAFPE